MLRSSYSYLIVVAIGLTIGVIGIWYIARPSFSAIINNQKRVSTLTKQLNEAEEKLALLKEFDRNPEEFTNTRELIVKALPAFPDTATFAIRIEELSKNLEVSLTNLAAQQQEKKAAPKKQVGDKSTGSTTSKDKKTTPASEATATAQAESFPFSTTIAGTYEQLSGWLTAVERLIPLTRINQLVINANQDVLTASITGESYFLKQKQVGVEVMQPFNVSETVLTRLEQAIAPGTAINLSEESGFGKQNPFGATAPLEDKKD